MTHFPDRRPPRAERSFTSDAVEAAIAEVGNGIADRELAWMFANTLPNTLDTTITFTDGTAGRSDTFVITGDIDAMWLRDSTDQVWPYLPLLGKDEKLDRLFRGVIRRQVRCVALDRFANAFYRDDKVGHWSGDHTEMRPGVHERKYELDSLAAVLRLSRGYFEATGNAEPFDDEWVSAMRTIVRTVDEQRAGSDEESEPIYHFQREARSALDTLPLAGRGHPARRCGLSKSPFRPSDDAASLPFHVPANAMASVELVRLGTMLRRLDVAPDLAAEAMKLAADLREAILVHAVIAHPRHGDIFAYEIDGFGSHYLMDDANVPSLLSLPYLGFCTLEDATYQRTRAFCLSSNNPYFASGSAGAGIGGPHIGLGWIWPMSITMRALTSDSDEEIAACLRTLSSTHAGTGFLHETFWKDDASRFTRPWFAWANSLFGELIFTLHRTRPHLLAKR